MSYNYDSENIFAKILRQEIPNDTVLDSEHTLAFKDINPAAPIHILIIPKGSYVNYDHFITEASEEEIIDFNRTVAKVISDSKINPSSDGDGYRIIANTGLNGVQEVPHLHFHILAGKNMGPMVIR